MKRHHLSNWSHSSYRSYTSRVPLALVSAAQLALALRADLKGRHLNLVPQVLNQFDTVFSQKTVPPSD